MFFKCSKIILTMIGCSCYFNLEAKIKVDESSTYFLDAEEEAGENKELSGAINQENGFNAFLKDSSSYQEMKTSKILNNFLTCCQIGNHKDIDDLMTKISKKLQRDDLFFCGIAELSLLIDLKDQGLVSERCIKSFTKQLASLIELAKDKIAASADESSKGSLKPYLEKKSSNQISLRNKVRDLNFFMQHVKNELRVPGCFEKNGKLEFEPGTYIDGLVDLNILAGNPIFQINEEARLSIAKLIKTAQGNGYRFFESSKIFPIISRQNKNFVINYYRGLIESLINDCLSIESFRQDLAASKIILSIKSKILHQQQLDQSSESHFFVSGQESDSKPGSSLKKVKSNIFRSPTNISASPKIINSSSSRPRRQHFPVSKGNIIKSSQAVSPRVLINLSSQPARKNILMKVREIESQAIIKAKPPLEIEPAETQAKIVADAATTKVLNKPFKELKTNAKVTHKRIRGPFVKKQE